MAASPDRSGAVKRGERHRWRKRVQQGTSAPMPPDRASGARAPPDSDCHPRDGADHVGRARICLDVRANGRFGMKLGKLSTAALACRSLQRERPDERRGLPSPSRAAACAEAVGQTAGRRDERSCSCGLSHRSAKPCSQSHRNCLPTKEVDNLAVARVRRSRRGPIGFPKPKWLVVLRSQRAGMCAIFDGKSSEQSRRRGGCLFLWSA